MSEKRGPSGSFGSAQLVKRQKSDANLHNGRSVAVVNGSAQNGALIQNVCNPSIALLYDRQHGAKATLKRHGMADYGGMDRYRAQVDYSLR